MPFGEELQAGIGGRSENLKYSANGTDNVRKRFTGYEKDAETGLDFAEARYYNNAHGRFTAVDPLLASGQSTNPQSFNRYAYTTNNPVNLTDPSGLIPESTAACGSRCPNSGPSVDGSAFRGRDTSFDWIPELVRGLTAKSEGADKKPTALTSVDRKSLEKRLRKLAPGTFVTREGQVFTKRSNTVGYRLLSGISKSGFNVTIVVNHRGAASTGPVNSDLTRKLTSDPSDTRVLWDPDGKLRIEERLGNGRIDGRVMKSAVVLAHELIHAYNWTRPGNTEFYDTGAYTFEENSIKYLDDSAKSELRAVGLGNYNLPGDITENDIRAQLGLNPRAAYADRHDWFNCSTGNGLRC